MGIDISRGIRMARKKCGYTQAEMGKAIGVNPNTISSYERGKTQPSMDILLKIAEISGLSLVEVLAYEEYRRFIEEGGDKNKNSIDFLDKTSKKELLEKYKELAQPNFYKKFMFNNNIVAHQNF